MRELPARLNGWHGTPPATRSTESMPQAVRRLRNSAGSERSPHHESPGRLASCVRTAHSSESAPTSTSNPARSSPSERPPAPQNRSIAVGRAARREELADRGEVGGLRAVRVPRRPRREPAMMRDLRASPRIGSPRVRSRITGS